LLVIVDKRLKKPPTLAARRKSWGIFEYIVASNGYLASQKMAGSTA
jgi:hypothetical protein